MNGNGGGQINLMHQGRGKVCISVQVRAGKVRMGFLRGDGSVLDPVDELIQMFPHYNRR